MPFSPTPGAGRASRSCARMRSPAMCCRARSPCARARRSNSKSATAEGPGSAHRRCVTEGDTIMDLQLNDKTALITGSTAGIGLEIARKLAVEGATVIITGRNKAKLDRAVDSIRASGGARVSFVFADASTEEGAAALVRATPSVDILVTNLGIYEIKDFAPITNADWRTYLQLNLLTAV